MILGRTSVLNHSRPAPILQHSQSQAIQALSRGVAKSVGTGLCFLIPSLSRSWKRCASKELLSLWHTGHASRCQVPRLILSASVSTYEMELKCILGYGLIVTSGSSGQVGPHREVTTGRGLHKRQILMGGGSHRGGPHGRRWAALLWSPSTLSRSRGRGSTLTSSTLWE